MGLLRIRVVDGHRYSFATVPHANEIQEPAERVQACSSLEEAASITARLNAEDTAA